MKTFVARTVLTLSALLPLTACQNPSSSKSSSAADNGPLVGAWQSKIVFQSGSLAGMKNLEFLYSYNAGGTMTESSNYDEAANSSPPAYGIWKQVDARTFETKYLFYTTNVPGPGDGAPNNHDWWPAGHGVLTETITLSNDGRTYSATVKLLTFDVSGNPVAGGGEGTGAGTRITF